MAEIPIERRRRSPLAWILGLLVLVALGFGLWWFFVRDDGAAAGEVEEAIAAASVPVPAIRT